MQVYLETERLIIRDLLESDLEGIYALDSDPLVHQYLGNNPISTYAQAEKNITFIRQQYTERGIGRWAVVHKASGEFMGWTGLKYNIDDEIIYGNKPFYDIGYRLIRRFWGKGYATESAIASLQYGFNTLKFDTIVGLAETENAASNAILKTIGLQFKHAFSYKDVVVNWYDLNKETYEQKNMS